jgi:tetratricopeptide (TPR) repeat protein
MSTKTVFISYRRDTAGKWFARTIKDALTHHGYDVFLDVDSIDAGEWAAQILTQVPKRAHFLLLLTPGALDRCAQEDDWVRKEFLSAVTSKRNIVPVREESVVLSELRKTCPDCMQGLFNYQTTTVEQSRFAQDIETLITRYIPPHKAPAEAPPAATAPFRADIDRIIKYAPEKLIGRESETELLNHAWNQAVSNEPKRPHVLTFVALGGEGKTSLVAKWAADLAHQNWPGCTAVFAWSFYSQGTREQTAASSDLFLNDALIFFGDAAMAGSAQSAYDKGRRLAQLVGAQRALLILDGVEPLQYAPTAPTPGELKDQGLAALLKGLAATSHGLCVVTTRYAIPDLRNFQQTTAPLHELKRLSTPAGVAMLKALGVKGQQKEFETLTEAVKGHALALNLFGSYLRDAHSGDIRKRDLVKLTEADAEVQGGHAFRVMDAYALAFEREGEKGLRALALLRLLGLFDRPADAACLAALLQPPAIPKLTEALVGISEAQRNLTFTRLASAKLLTVNRDAAGTLLSLDAHPLLREYFAVQLRQQQPEVWRAGHRRLYEHLCASTPDKPNATLEDLQPLYQAVAHGCQAGLQQEACVKVYRDRILRGTGSDGFYSIRKLGAFGADLGALACFFDTPWHRVSPALTEAAKAWLLNEAASSLPALGRLTEALEPMRVGLEMNVQVRNWKAAAACASNLSDLNLTLGKVTGAISDAEQSVTYIDHSGDVDWQNYVVSRSTHANALHQAGFRDAAEARFREAEARQAKDEPECALLYSVQGFRYCDLLLTQAERAAWQQFLAGDGSRLLLGPLLPSSIGMGAAVREPLLRGAARPSRKLIAASGDEPLHNVVLRTVLERAVQTLEWSDGKLGLLTIALDHLTLGRTALYRAILRKSDLRFSISDFVHVDTALDGLRRAGTQHYLPRGLLTRAWLRSLTGATTTAQHGPDSAQSDLDEAWEIAERGPMPLFMADIHLYRARLFFGVTPYPWASPRDDLAKARALIEKHGYWRRKEELEDAEAAAKGW